MKSMKVIFAVLAVVLMGAGAWFWLGRSAAESPIEDEGEAAVAASASDSRASRKEKSVERRARRAEKMEKSDDEEEMSEDAGEEETGVEVPEQTEEEKREAAEEALVDAFDNLTDTWQEPSEKGVTMEQIAKFREQFNKVPKDRKEECLQRALNLVPDDNVMLLAGILLDKSQDKELIELVYNDILNRDEDVKGPILKEIFKDKEHPCWADTAWILDVTGEGPKKDE